MRLGEKTPLDKVTAFDGHEAGTEAFNRMKDHLAQNKVTGTTEVLVGKSLTVDSASEKIVGDEAANKLLTREYRAPYVVPEQV